MQNQGCNKREEQLWLRESTLAQLLHVHKNGVMDICEISNTLLVVTFRPIQSSPMLGNLRMLSARIFVQDIAVLTGGEIISEVRVISRK